jgi:uncharacterized protein (TIGR03435 family)
MDRLTHILISLIGTATLAPLHAQSRPALPRFEVASIKACKEPVDQMENREGGGNRIASPGMLNLPCQSLGSLIQIAYFRANGGKTNLQLEGGPSWIGSERYQVTAKAQGAVGQQILEGAMLQDLLQNRFHLKTHRETREAPVYALTVAGGGLKMKPAEPGSCIPMDPGQEASPETEPGRKPRCGDLMIKMGVRRTTFDVASGTMTQLAQNLAARLGRPGVDRTGKLQPAKGPREFLVIDHVEQPSEN